MENKEKKSKQEINEIMPEERLKKAKNRRIRYQILTVIFIIAIICEIAFGIVPILAKNNSCKTYGGGELEIMPFNGKFEAYEGTSVKGSNVKQLIKITYQHNLQNKENEDKQVNITLKTQNDGDINLVTKGDNITKDETQITVSKSYKVECKYNEKNGFISSIVVIEK